MRSFLGGSGGKASASNVGDLGSIPGLGRSPGEGNGTPLQYSCLENPMDRGAWWVTIHGVSKSWTRLSNFIYHLLSRDALEKSSESRMCETYERAARIAHYGELKSPSTKRDWGEWRISFSEGRRSGNNEGDRNDHLCDDQNHQFPSISKFMFYNEC